MDKPPPYDRNQFENPAYGNIGSTQHYPSAPMSSTYNPPIMTAPQPATTTTTNVIIGGGAVPGGCPVCHNRNWTGSYSCCAWLWAICCFPCGIICCCCMRRKKCTKCGFTLS